MSREKAYEAATKALFGRMAMPLPNTWPEGAEDYEADRLRADAEAAVDAAAPFIEAAVLRETAGQAHVIEGSDDPVRAAFYWLRALATKKELGRS